MSTKYSTLEQNLEGFKTSVADTYVTNSVLSDTKSEIIQTAEEISSTVSNNTVMNLEIGGRNLLPDSEKIRETTRSILINVYDILTPYIGKSIVVSFDAKINEGGISRELQVRHYQDQGVSIGDTYRYTPTDSWQRFSFVRTVVDKGLGTTGTSQGQILFWDSTGNNNYSIRRIKIELGNKATDWSPAPEDTDSKISGVQSTITQLADEVRIEFENTNEAVGIAAGTATNYLKASTGGVVVGNHTADVLRNNVKIDTDSVDIRNGENVLASFEDNLIDLGKDSNTATIAMCNGAAKLYTRSYDDSIFNGFSINSNKLAITNSDYVDDADSSYGVISIGRYQDGGTYTSMTSTANHVQANIDVYADHSETEYIPVGIRLTASRYRDGWDEQELRITDGGTYLSDNEKLIGPIRPWNVVLFNSSANLMSGNDVALRAPISEQPTGVVLAFFDGTDSSWYTFFIPKLFVTEENGFNYCASWVRSDGTRVRKTFRITDTALTGTSSTTNGLLQKVYGV
jgi:hypothetical protein